MSFAIDRAIVKNSSRNYYCNQPCMQTHLPEHCSSADHCGFVEHVSIN